MKRLAELIMQGLPQAVAVAAGFAILSLLLPPVGILSSAVIGLVALKVGLRQAVYVTLITSAMLGVIVIGMGQQGLLGVLSGLIQWLPVALLGALLARTASWTLVMQSVFAVGVVTVVLLYLLFPDLDQFWLKTMKQLLQPALEDAGGNAQSVQASLVAVAPLVTGVLISALLVTSLLGLMLARSMQAALENPGGFAREFQALRIGGWAAGLSVLFLALASVVSQPWTNALATVSMAVFLIQGFAVVHGVVARLGWPKGTIIGLYVLLMVFLTPVVLVIAGLGIVDAFADFRRRLGGPAQ